MTNAAFLPVNGPPSLADRMIERGLLIPTATPGVWGKSADYERVVNGLERAIDEETQGDGAERLRFPPVIARSDFERSDFLKSFPHLAGAVYAFSGSSSDHETLLGRIESGEDTSELFQKTELVLVPAACYPIYAYARDNAITDGLFDVCSFCFRHEPSSDPTRLVSFRMREQVRLGSPDDALSFRESWLSRAERFMHELCLPFQIGPAHDPFFGRGGRLLAASQKMQGLKFELSIPITSVESPTAVMSFNYHQDHFGHAFGIGSLDARVHSACVGFGLERIALALFAVHGVDFRNWPSSVRTRLVS